MVEVALAQVLQNTGEAAVPARLRNIFGWSISLADGRLMWMSDRLADSSGFEGRWAGFPRELRGRLACGVTLRFPKRKEFLPCQTP